MNYSLKEIFRYLFLIGLVLLFTSLFLDWYYFQIILYGEVIASWSYNPLVGWYTLLSEDNILNTSNIVFLSGGTGTPKLLLGVVEVTDAQNITIIGNTGDDWNFYGLHVSPDIDSILLTLTDLIDTEKWWGIKDDTFNMVDFLKNQLKEEVWFNLGDFDAGLCLYRSYLLNQGRSLTEAIEIIRRRLDIQSRVLPMADQTIQTIVRTPEQTMHLQEYWVKYKGKVPVKNVFFEGDLRNTTNQVSRRKFLEK